MGARYRFRSGGNAAAAWRDQAVCSGVNPDIFFPDPSDDATAEIAKRICAGCPVREDCLEHAIAFNEREGVWGGYNEQERRSLRRARTRAASRQGIA